jgi:hypothetical protein
MAVHSLAYKNNSLLLPTMQEQQTHDKFIPS